MEKINIYFDEYESREEALDNFREELEEAGIVDEFGFWATEEPFLIAVDNRSINVIYPEEKETYKSFWYSTFTPSFYADYNDMLYDIEQDLKNRGGAK